jgi:translation initiation factor eIF-2B subunit gamma
MQLDTSAKKKAGTVNHQDFKAVIPVGYGEKLAQLVSLSKAKLTGSLYPLNQGTHVVTKALLPIGNVPIINLVLDWVLESGLRGKSQLGSSEVDIMLNV